MHAGRMVRALLAGGLLAVGVACSSDSTSPGIPASLAVSSSPHADKTSSPTRIVGENRCARLRGMRRTVVPSTQPFE